MPLDLDEARIALAAAAGRPSPPPHLLLARHADLWRYRLGVPLDPIEAVLAVAVLDDDARGLAALLVDTAAAASALPAALLAVDATTAVRVFLGCAATLGPRLPPAVVRAQAVRQEELLRRFAAFNGIALIVGGKPEPTARSAQVLERLDYRVVRIQEDALARDRTLIEARREALARIASGAPL
ncbi:MAG: hypothetical protein KC620_07270 [Myxococcales bacterium]|nr:hypothetical protein [Myxococcales bacterium]